MGPQGLQTEPQGPETFQPEQTEEMFSLHTHIGSRGSSSMVRTGLSGTGHCTGGQPFMTAAPCPAQQVWNTGIPPFPLCPAFSHPHSVK